MPGMVNSETQRDVSVIILAAGRGTRMKSEVPKVMHHLGGRPIIEHVLSVASQLAPSRSVVVVGPEMESVAVAVNSHVGGARTVEQSERLGTGHAVLMAREQLSEHQGDILVLYADTPLIEPGTLRRLLDARRANAAVAVLGFHARTPGAYGRLIVDGDGELESIVEACDAAPEELAADYCNSGVMAVEGPLLFDLLQRVGNDNAKGEYYLTDIVDLARRRGLRCAAVECDETEVLGINSRSELSLAEAVFQNRARDKAMAAGVTLIDPRTVYFSFDTRLGRDVTVEPNVLFGPGVTVGDDVTIRAFCSLEQTTVGNGAVIGPFARLRPGAEIGEQAHVGNFVEIKKAVVEQGVKVNHLTYIGDAFIGAGSNIGAGTITCNYDGFEKHHTHIGKDVFVGSNNSLIAPVRIEDGAYTGSGSVISDDVKRGALALERSPQRQVAGWAAKFKKRRHDKKTGS